MNPQETHADLVEGADEAVAKPGRRDATVHAEDLAVDDGGDGHDVEYLICYLLCTKLLGNYDNFYIFSHMNGVLI